MSILDEPPRPFALRVPDENGTTDAVGVRWGDGSATVRWPHLGLTVMWPSLEAAMQSANRREALVWFDQTSPGGEPVPAVFEVLDLDAQNPGAKMEDEAGLRVTTLDDEPPGGGAANVWVQNFVGDVAQVDLSLDSLVQLYNHLRGLIAKKTTKGTVANAA